MSSRKLQQATISFNKLKSSTPPREGAEVHDDELTLQCPICFQYVLVNALHINSSSNNPLWRNTLRSACRGIIRIQTNSIRKEEAMRE